MHESIRILISRQTELVNQKDQLVEAVKEQTRMFHEFHADMRVLLHELSKIDPRE